MIRFLLNGREVESGAHPLARLIDVLREEMGDTSVKEGCGEGECGACSVLKDGRLVNACLLPAIQAEGSVILTAAGLKGTERGKRIIEAFAREGAVQCGFCIPGMVLAAEALLAANPRPAEPEIRTAISGNLCRCTGYDHIVRAIASAAEAAPLQKRGT
jgi:aerobic-type carbon monoxide dehydrogenase small subunit (CoxS/CutS family)